MAAEVKLKLTLEDDGTVQLEQISEEFEETLEGMADTAEKAGKKVNKSYKGMRDSQGRFVRTTKTSTSKVRAAMNRMSTNVKRVMTKFTGHFGAGIAMMKKFLITSALIGSVLSTAAVGAFGKSIISASSDMENFTVQFEVFYGSAERAAEVLQMVRKVAGSTPFQLPEVIQTTKLLKVLTDGALDNAEGIRMVGNAATVSGQPIGELATWYGRLYSEIQAGGDTMGEALRRLTELGLITPTAKKGLEQLRDAGASTTVMWDAFTDSQKQFSGIMSKGMGTLSGIISNLGDNLLELRTVIGDQLLGDVKAVAAEMRDWIGEMSRSDRAVKFGENLRDTFRAAVAGARALFGYIDSRKDTLLLIGKVVGVFVALKLAILAIASPITAVMFLVVGSIELFHAYKEEIVAFSNNSTSALQTWLQNNERLVDGVKGVFRSLGNYWVNFIRISISVWSTFFSLLGDYAVAAANGIVLAFKQVGNVFDALIHGNFSEINTIMSEFDSKLSAIQLPDISAAFKEQVEKFKTIMGEDYISVITTKAKDGAIVVSDIFEATMKKFKGALSGTSIGMPTSDEDGGDTGTGGGGGGPTIMDQFEFTSGTQQIMNDYFDRIYQGAVDGGLKVGKAFRFGFEEAVFKIGTTSQIGWDMGANLAEAFHQGFSNTFKTLMQGGDSEAAFKDLLTNIADITATGLSDMLSKTVTDKLSSKLEGLMDAHGDKMLGIIAAGAQAASMVASGNYSGSAIGSTLGMIGGAIIGGTTGAMIGGAAGGLLGGLFDSNEESRENISKIADNTKETNTQLAVVNHNLSGLRADINKVFVLPSSAFFSERNANNELATQLNSDQIVNNKLATQLNMAGGSV